MAHDPNDAPKGPVAEDPALDSLETRLAAARKKEEERLAQDNASLGGTGPALGLNVVSTMIGYPLGGIIVGFGIDQWLDTTPWVTIGLMFTAFAGAVLQVVRSNQHRK